MSSLHVHREGSNNLVAFLMMLPASAVSSIQEQIVRFRNLEDNTGKDDITEEERDALFALPVQRRSSHNREPDLTEVLLRSDFENDDARGIENTSAGKDSTRTASPASSLLYKNGKHPEWPASPIHREISSIVRNIKTVTVCVPSASGVYKKIEMQTAEVSRLRGTDGGILKWLDDVTIANFVHLVNMRSRRHMINLQGTGREPHKPSGCRNMFSRPRVLAHIFNTQFFAIWNREKNGTYSAVKNWRRKIKDYSSVGMFMILALVDGSHWVLAIVDIDGMQFIYYDPYGSTNSHKVVDCAQDWVKGEVNSSKKSDTFCKLDPSKWPVVINPSGFPRQADAQSCGVFVIYAAEHIERGVFPSFTQSDIPVLRKRALWFLHEGIIHDDGDY